MYIRKSLLFACLSIALLGITACSSTKKDNTPTADFSDTTVTTIAPTAGISPSAIPRQNELLTHTVTSHDGNSTAIANTKKESYDDSVEIIDKIVINNKDGTLEINDLVGYYKDMCWSRDDTKLLVSYYGRTWSNFTVFNAIDATPLYSEVPFHEIRSFFEGEGIIFDYKENEDRPDVRITFENWSEDCKSIKVMYSVTDTQWQTQSGTFWYDLDTGNMRDLEQNPPYEAG